MPINPVRSPADIRKCAPLFAAVFNEAPSSERWTLKTAGSRLTEIYRNGKGYCFYATQRGEVTGCIFCERHTWDDGPHLIVSHLTVHEAYRSQGIGSRLVKHVEGLAKKEGFTSILLTSNVSGPGAEFWRAREYRPTGFIQMEKRLKR